MISLSAIMVASSILSQSANSNQPEFCNLKFNLSWDSHLTSEEKSTFLRDTLFREISSYNEPVLGSWNNDLVDFEFINVIYRGRCVYLKPYIKWYQNKTFKNLKINIDSKVTINSSLKVPHGYFPIDFKPKKWGFPVENDFSNRCIVKVNLPHELDEIILNEIVYDVLYSFFDAQKVMGLPVYQFYNDMRIGEGIKPENRINSMYIVFWRSCDQKKQYMEEFIKYYNTLKSTRVSLSMQNIDFNPSVNKRLKILYPKKK